MRASKDINVDDFVLVLENGCKIMQQVVNKAAASWQEQNIEYNYEARGDVREAAAYIKNTSDLYLEYSN